MESKFTLKATDKEAQTFFDNYHVKLMEFKGDKTAYPEMDFNSNTVHPWAVILRHPDEVGRINGTRAYASVVKRLTAPTR